MLVDQDIMVDKLNKKKLIEFNNVFSNFNLESLIDNKLSCDFDLMLIRLLIIDITPPLLIIFILNDYETVLVLNITIFKPQY